MLCCKPYVFKTIIYYINISFNEVCSQDDESILPPASNSRSYLFLISEGLHFNIRD